MPAWRRNLTLIIAAYVALTVGLYAVQSGVVLESYATLERSHAERDLQRAHNALQQHLLYLDRTAYDWAAWDDTYEFMADRNEDYAESNLVAGTYTALGVNLIALVEPDGSFVFSRFVSLETEEEISIREFSGPSIDASYALLAHQDEESQITGIVMLSQGPLLIASRPILTSEDEGPIRGTLLMGCLLDQDFVQDLSSTTQLDLRVQPLHDPEDSAADQMAAAQLLAGTSPVARPLDEQTLLAQTLLTDLNGEPALILSASLARDIHQQGLASQRRLGEALALSCAVFLLALGQIGRRAAQESAVRLRAEKDLRQAHDELEERVIDRTVELSAANATLGQEIRRREKAQQSLQGTLDEKELLLRELHHRVKNSLQVITNLLYLQATEVKSPEALKALDECRGRVRSVALLHSALETASEVGRVEFCAYAEILATELLESFRPQPGEVRLHVQGEPTHLPTRQAVVSGLVLNELVTNALKHAFPNGRGGEVRLGVSSQDGNCVLEVSDDGQGLPEGMGVHEAKSLGLRLVGMLVDQLDGRIEVNSTEGTQVVIRFPIAATA